MSDNYHIPEGPVQRNVNRGTARRGRGAFASSSRRPTDSTNRPRNGIASYMTTPERSRTNAQDFTQTPLQAPPDTLRGSFRRDLGEPIVETAATPTLNVPIPTVIPTATQDSQSSEDDLLKAIQEQVDAANHKRDQRDPDFVRQPRKRKRSHSDSRNATPTATANAPTPPATPGPPRPKGRGVKRYDDCTNLTRADRWRLVQSISGNWKAPQVEWVPEALAPSGEPRDWGVPMLTQLRRLSELTRNDIASAHRIMSTVVTRRTTSDEGGRMLSTEDVKGVIRTFASRNNGLDFAARSPTLAPNTDDGRPAQSTVRFENATNVRQPSVPQPDNTEYKAQLPSSGSPDQAARSSRSAGKQPVKSEPVAESSRAGASNAAAQDDGMRDTYERIEEIYRLRAEEAKAKARRLVLEDKHRRWKSLTSRGSSWDDALMGETIGD